MRVPTNSRCVLMTLLVAIVAMHSWCLAGGSVTVTDLARRGVTVPKDPQRIICLSPGTLRLICYLRAQDKLVGVEDFEKKRPVGRPYWWANPQLAQLPSIGPGGPKSINAEPDLEAVLKIKPDVIFVSYMRAANADALQNKISIPVVVVTYGRFASFDPIVFQSLRVLGKVMGKEKRAEAAIGFIEDARKDLLKRVGGIEDSQKARVYVGAIGYKGFQGIESTDATHVPQRSTPVMMKV